MPGSLDTPGAAGARVRARRRTLLLPHLAAAAMSVADAPAAQAGVFQLAILQDDLQLLYSGPQRREAVLDEAKRLGFDSVRAFVSWTGVAPVSGSTVRPGFDSATPAGYPAGEWDRYD